MAVIEKNGTYMALPMAIKRGNPVSLDTTAIWYSLEELQTYAQTGPTAYVGQILALVDEASNSAKAYIIANAAGDLQEVGSATLGDNKTITLKEDGALALKNWGVEYYKWVDSVGTEGDEGYVAGHHEKQVVDAERPWIAGLEPKALAGADGTFELAWYQPSTTTVEGLNSTVTTIQTTVNEINNALGTAETEGTIRYDIANKLDKAGGIMTGDITLKDGGKVLSNIEIQNLVSSAGHLKRAVVDVLPEVATADANTIYMVKDATVTSGDAYKEYMLIDGAFAQIGDTSVNLEPYAKKTVPTVEDNIAVLTADGSLKDGGKTIAGVLADVDTKLGDYVAKEAGKSLVADEQITKLAGLANIKTIGNNLTLSEDGILSAKDSYQLPIASTTTLGGVMIDGTTIKIDETGKISVPVASATEGGLLSKEDFAKIQNIEAGAQVNIIEGVLCGTEELVPVDKKITIPVATEEKLGVVKGSTENDKISIGADGTMGLNKVSTTKLYVPDTDELILDGGQS